MSEPRSDKLRMYRKEAEGDSLPWSWAEARLKAAPTYWLATVRRDGTPHTRPIWGVWLEGQLVLSAGSWEHWRAVQAGPRVSVHLDSSFEVVVVEGTAEVAADAATIARFVELYNPKYDWHFDAENLNPPPVVVRPDVVLAWETKGAAGRDGFARTGKWLFDPG